MTQINRPFYRRRIIEEPICYCLRLFENNGECEVSEGNNGGVVVLRDTEVLEAEQ